MNLTWKSLFSTLISSTSLIHGLLSYIKHTNTKPKLIFINRHSLIISSVGFKNKYSNCSESTSVPIFVLLLGAKFVIAASAWYSFYSTVTSAWYSFCVSLLHLTPDYHVWLLRYLVKTTHQVIYNGLLQIRTKYIS